MIETYIEVTRIDPGICNTKWVTKKLQKGNLEIVYIENRHVSHSAA
jgi:hypothetical protein